MNKFILRRRIYIIIGIAIVCFFFSFSNCDDSKALFGFKGDVKSCLEQVYDVEQKSGKWYNGDIKNNGHSLIKFDAEGNYVEINKLNDNGEVVWRIIPIRDSSQTIEEVYYNKSGKKECIVKISLLNKNEMETISYDIKGKRIGRGKIFIEHGKKVKNVFFPESKSKEYGFVILWEYDKEGNLISEKNTSIEGEIRSYQQYKYIEFDKRDNWTKRLIYEGGNNKTPKGIAIRGIEYY